MIKAELLKISSRNKIKLADGDAVVELVADVEVKEKIYRKAHFFISYYSYKQALLNAGCFYVDEGYSFGVGENGN